MGLINLFCSPGFQGIVPIWHAKVQISKFLLTCQKSLPKVDPIFWHFSAIVAKILPVNLRPAQIFSVFRMVG